MHSTATTTTPAMLPQREAVIQIPLSELHPFPNHPYQVRDDEAMRGMLESVREFGVLTPAIVRPCKDDGYEIIAGHRRKHASEMAGLETMPAIVREMDDDSATILMVDSNIQREDILPSEKAQAYKMKMDALKRKAGRPPKDNCGHAGCAGWPLFTNCAAYPSSNSPVSGMIKPLYAILSFPGFDITLRPV